MNIVEQNPDLMDDIQLDLIKPQEKNDKNENGNNFLELKRKIITEK